MRTVWLLIVKELKQFVRDPLSMRMIILMPLIQLFLLGYVITTDVRNLGMCIVDLDGSSHSRKLAGKLFAAGYFIPAGEAAHAEEVVTLLENRTASVGIVIPEDFSRRLDRQETAAIQVLLDGTDANSARVAFGYLNAILRDFSQDIVVEWVRRNPDGSEHTMAGLASVVCYNPDLESRNYMIPGIIVILMTMTTSALTSMGIVREREIGTLEQIMVTPIRPAQLMAGKTVPYALVCTVITVIAIGLARWHFHIPIRGSLLLLFGCIVLFLFNTLGLGLLVSTISKTQQQALFLTWFVNIFAIIMSNFFIPIHNMPVAVQYLTYANPVRYFMSIVRTLFLKGGGLPELWPNIAALALSGAIIFTLSAVRFSKRLT
ncbi:ABC transporter permease [bacterium]|nr:ABC transporter permease [candidate division CSSED10-310 bacterium]